jgi:hypothetical protein
LLNSRIFHPLPFLEKLQSFLNSPQNFIFSFPSHQCHCNCESAFLLSPKVRSLHLSDPTFCEFSLTFLDSPDFPLILENLIHGNSFELNCELALSVAKLLKALENPVLIDILLRLNIGNAVYRLRRDSILGIDLSSNLDFLATNFSQFEFCELMKIELDDLLALFHRLPSIGNEFTQKFVEEIVREKGEKYQILKEVLSLPDWCLQKAIECFTEDEEILKPPETIWKIPIDCSQIFQTNEREEICQKSNFHRRCLIGKEESELVSEFIQKRSIESTGILPLMIEKGFLNFEEEFEEEEVLEFEEEEEKVEIE